MEVSRVEVDERVGGHVRIWHTHNGQDAGGFECRLIELVPDKRIVFQWGFVGPRRTKGPTYDSLLTITLRVSPGNTTTLTLVHERLDDLEQALPDVGPKRWGRMGNGIRQADEAARSGAKVMPVPLLLPARAQ